MRPKRSRSSFAELLGEYAADRSLDNSSIGQEPAGLEQNLPVSQAPHPYPFFAFFLDGAAFAAAFLGFALLAARSCKLASTRAM